MVEKLPQVHKDGKEENITSDPKRRSSGKFTPSPKMREWHCTHILLNTVLIFPLLHHSSVLVTYISKCRDLLSAFFPSWVYLPWKLNQNSNNHLYLYCVTSCCWLFSLFEMIFCDCWGVNLVDRLKQLLLFLWLGYFQRSWLLDLIPLISISLHNFPSFSMKLLEALYKSPEAKAAPQ